MVVGSETNQAFDLFSLQYFNGDDLSDGLVGYISALESNHVVRKAFY